MNKAIIFGGCGYIGINYAEFLANKNEFEIIYLADVQKPTQNYLIKKFNNLFQAKKIIFLEINVRNEIINNDLKDIDLIVDCAAVHREPGHQDHEYYETNVNGSSNICKFAEKINCKNIIFTSSISTYGSGNHEKDESTETKPTTAYGKSKLEAETNYINWKQNSDSKILTICRPGVVFGPGELGNVTRLIKAIKKNSFFFMGNKDLKKGGIYIKELINALYWVNENQINKNFKNFELFNATFYPCPTIYDYVISINLTLNIKKKYISFPKIIIKFFIDITSVITKNLKSSSSFHYIRLNKLFISNFIKPSFLLSKNYSFKYSLKSSMEDWKKSNYSDWI
tara:strand:+ start:84 stop:1103 length:1020 start_codon:yes stop_codon:yes gene_type:complete